MGRRLFLSVVFFAFSLSCTRTVTVPAEEERNGATVNGPTPATYCGTSAANPGGVAITGSANYQVRPLLGSVAYPGSGLGTETQSQDPANTYPIRLAEIRVTNAAGTLIQCGETQNDGSFSFNLPVGTTGNITISVNSRIKNSNETINVFDKPETNRFYTISGTINVPGTTNLDLVATVASPTVKGGAFNILDKILLTNEYLRTKTAGCVFTGCTPFTTAHSVNVYWVAGFNPGSYFGSGGLSFYLPGYYRIFILGGLNGDINNTDTDHFDNSIIIHEYGHFLEDTVFGSDSPGGFHDGQQIVDPRLAWSEGWGNFIQSAVIAWAGLQTGALPRYQDTVGNGDGLSTMYAFNVNLEEDGPGVAYDKVEEFGEGIFREFSVTRMLNDMLDNTPAEAEVWPEGATTDDVMDNFDALWASLTKVTDNGFQSPNARFRNAGQVHLAQGMLAGAPNDSWTNARGIERHKGDMSEYAQFVTTGLGCTDTASITPVDIVGDDGSFGDSHLLLNNDFYHVKLTATSNISLEYNDANGAGVEADLDMYIYNTNARFGNTADIVASAYTDADGNPATAQTEGPRTLAPGHYLINVFVWTGGAVGGPVNYRLKLGSQVLCPTNLPN